MLKICKKCKNNFECPIQYEENDMCKSCYLKWKEKALKCKNCKALIDWHNYYWHIKLCDNCYELRRVKSV